MRGRGEESRLVRGMGEQTVSDTGTELVTQ